MPILYPKPTPKPKKVKLGLPRLGRVSKKEADKAIEPLRKFAGLRKQRKTSRAALVRKLDKAVSKLTRMREKACVTCGATERLTNGHLFSRIAYSLRWDVTTSGNCHVQCMGCNMRHEYDPYPYTSWYVKTYGIDKYEELHKRWSTPVKFTTYELEVMLSGVKAMLEEYK